MGLISKHKVIFLISFVFFLTVTYMLPLRNQAFQDDWAYIQSVKLTLSSEKLVISDWVAPASITTTLLATFMSLIFGYSEKITHITTLVLLYFGLLAFYFTLRRLQIETKRSVIFTLLLLGFPWVFQFSYTFITEVPFMSLMLISLFFYSKGLQDKKPSALAFGSFFAGCAYLVRQLGMAIPISVFLLLVYRSISTKKVCVKEMLAALLPILVMGIVYYWWLAIPGNKPNALFQVEDIFSREVIPYWLPIQLRRTGATYGYYATYIQRVLFYFHHGIGFLLPIFVLFQPPKNILAKFSDFITKYWKGILGATLFYAFCFLIEKVYHYARVEYTLEEPNLVTRYDVFTSINWIKNWKYFVWVSVPLWIMMLGSAVQTALESVFVRRKVSLRKNIILLSLFALSAVLYQIAVFLVEFKHYIPSNLNTFWEHKARIYLDTIFSEHGLAVFNTSWLVIFIPTFIFFIAAYVLLNTKLKLKKLKEIEGMLLLTFCLQYVMLIILGYFHWAQYTISLVPYFLFFLCYMTRNVKISIFRSIVIVFLFLAASATATKFRYQSYGIRWETGTKLVEMGIEPIDISYTDEAWLPWWYYADTFKEYAQSKGSKYAIRPGEWATWRKVTSNSKFYYDYSMGGTAKNSEDTKVLLDITYHTSIFSKDRIQAIQKLKESASPN